jgi:uncharacterized protein YggE
MNDNPSKRIPENTSLVAVIIFFVLLFVYSKWGPAVPFSVLSQPKGEPMIVSGQGKSTAIPDVAVVSAGVEDRGASLSRVQESVNKKSQDLVDSLKGLGINEEDIKTTSYNIYPQTDYDRDPPAVSGYQVSISYMVKVKEIEKVNDVLTTVTSAGANVVGGVSFELSDESRETAMQEAREDAVETAKKNAESLAKASGVTLGRIINISETQTGGFPRPMYAQDLKLAAEGMGGAENATRPDVQPGTTEIDITVSLSYELR